MKMGKHTVLSPLFHFATVGEIPNFSPIIPLFQSSTVGETPCFISEKGPWLHERGGAF
jgi:hypothetical protein